MVAEVLRVHKEELGETEKELLMTTLTIQLMEADYQRLEQAAKGAGKSLQAVIYDWIAQLPEVEESFDITQDPIFQMEGYESDAPADLSVNLDTYLYGKEYPELSVTEAFTNDHHFEQMGFTILLK